MEISFTLALFFVLSSALIGGYIVKKLKFQPIIGYILAGVITSSIFPVINFGIEKLAELGAILLLFSIGLELSLDKFGNILKKIFLASTLQMFFSSLILFFILKIAGFENISALILALGFSLSSTAIVVKILFDRGESETIHGKLMIGWLLAQDLAVVPIMVILPLLGNSGKTLLTLGGVALFKAFLIVIGAIISGRHIVPFIIHKITLVNSRELLVLTSIALAVGVSAGVSSLGITPTLGAFIAGFVISESQENHAVFAETRPLRDLFVALFFVTLGFMVNFSVILSGFWIILFLSLAVIISKFLIIVLVNSLLKFSGKTTIITALGLSQVGEFSFIIFSAASIINLISFETATIGISVSLLTLILTPFIYKNAIPLWRFLVKKFRLFSSFDRNQKARFEFSNHIVICGYGRVGGWVGKILSDKNIKFVVIDLNREVVNSCLDKGIPAIYGDPAEKEVLLTANIESAKVIIIAIPDRFSQESIIAHVQTLAPNAKIISRVHLDDDYEKLKNLRVDKLIQPEFEAAVAIVRDIFRSMGKNKEDVAVWVKSMRLSHAKI